MHVNSYFYLKHPSRMKKFMLWLFVAAVVAIIGCSPTADKPENDAKIAAYDSSNKTNDFYDDAESMSLKGNLFIEVNGEVANPGKVKFKKLKKI
jgi:hypothetical protein